MRSTQARADVRGADYKSALQERLQALGRPLPEYRVVRRSGSRPPQDVQRRGGRGRRSARRPRRARQRKKRSRKPRGWRLSKLESNEEHLYAVIGEDGFARLVRAFYAQVPGDDVLGPMYPAHDLVGAEERLRDFLIGRFGGPPRYIEQRGHPRLRMRHAPFAIDEAARNRWVETDGSRARRGATA